MSKKIEQPNGSVGLSLISLSPSWLEEVHVWPSLYEAQVPIEPDTQAPQHLVQHRWAPTSRKCKRFIQSLRSEGHATLRLAGGLSASSGSSAHLLSSSPSPQSTDQSNDCLTSSSSASHTLKLQFYTAAEESLAARTWGLRWRQSPGGGPRQRFFGASTWNGCTVHWSWRTGL